MNNVEQALISIIVAVYNVEKYIEQCIRSLINQSYYNLEIILVDDGSTDGSGKICEEWEQRDSRIRVIRQNNAGLSAARNVGLSVATGEYIAFVDGDDFVHLQMYEKMFAVMREYNVELVICKEMAFMDNDNPKDSRISDVRCNIETQRQLLNHFLDDFAGPVNWVWNKLYSRELIGNKRFLVGKKLEDIVFLTDILMETGKAVWIDERFCYYRQRSNSIMGMRQPDLWIDYANALSYQYSCLKTQAAMVNQEKNTVQFLKRIGRLEAEAYFVKATEARKDLREVFIKVYIDNIADVRSIKERVVIWMLRYVPVAYYVLKCKGRKIL